MNMNRVIKTTIICAIVALLNIFSQPDVKAAGNDIKQDKYMKKIVSDISYYTAAMMCSDQEAKHMTEKLKGYNALSIAAVVGYSKEVYSFSKNDIQKISYDLFGIKPSVSVIPESDSPKAKYLVKNNDVNEKEFQYYGGEFGMSIPKEKILKINKVKKNVYDVKVQNNLNIYSSNDRITNVLKMGTTNIRIRKNTKSNYKYNIIKLEYSKE